MHTASLMLVVQDAALPAVEQPETLPYAETTGDRHAFKTPASQTALVGQWPGYVRAAFAAAAALKLPWAASTSAAICCNVILFGTSF